MRKQQRVWQTAEKRAGYVMAAVLALGSATLLQAPGQAQAGANLTAPAEQVRQSATPAAAPAQIPAAPRPAATATPPPAAAPALPAAAVPPSAPEVPVVQGSWMWLRSEYNDDSVVSAADPGKYTLTLQPDGSMRVLADCNRGTGTYTVSGSQLTVALGAMTLAACPLGSQDAVFLRDLKNVAGYVFDGENLVLNLRVDGGNMVFAPKPSQGLTGVEWRVTGVNNGRGGLVSVLPDAPLTATFSEDGNVSGNSGCNLFRGGYTTDGTSIQVGELISTRRACISDALNAQEQQYLAALRAAATIEFEGNHLTLRDANGAMQVVLVAGS